MEINVTHHRLRLISVSIKTTENQWFAEWLLLDWFYKAQFRWINVNYQWNHRWNISFLLTAQWIHKYITKDYLYMINPTTMKVTACFVLYCPLNAIILRRVYWKWNVLWFKTLKSWCCGLDLDLITQFPTITSWSGSGSLFKVSSKSISGK